MKNLIVLRAEFCMNLSLFRSGDDILGDVGFPIFSSNLHYFILRRAMHNNFQ